MASDMIKEGGRNVYLIGGPPRSGTTWLQLLLSGTGLFQTSQETHLFPLFAAKLAAAWKLLSEDGGVNRQVGLSNIISEEEFYNSVRAFTSSVLSAVADSSNSQAKLILEKTPENLLHYEMIVKLYPQIRFIVLLRDPRAVVASTLAARSWAGRWAFADIVQLTQNWVNHVKAATALQSRTSHCLWVTYEKLRLGGPDYFHGICRQLDLQVTPMKARELMDTYAIARIRNQVAPAPWSLGAEPKGFFRLGETDSWRNELTTAQIAIIEETADLQMRLLGYERVVEVKRKSHP